MLQELQQYGAIRLTWRSHAGACDDCTRNDGQTVILGERFRSGAVTTPNHNHCQCTLEDEQGRKYELNTTADGYTQIVHQRSMNGPDLTYLFLDIDGVFSIASAGLPEKIIDGKEAWPIPLTNLLLKDIDENVGVVPIWMTHWGEKSNRWNEQAGINPWAVSYPLSQEDEDKAKQAYPDLDKKPLAIQYCMNNHFLHNAIWIQDGFTPEEQEWAAQARVRLINANEEPYHSLLLSNDERSVRSLMALLAI